MNTQKINIPEEDFAWEKIANPQHNRYLSNLCQVKQDRILDTFSHDLVELITLIQPRFDVELSKEYNPRKFICFNLGIDTVVDLGKSVLLIDNKNRRRKYDDVLLEETSNDRTGRRGWMHNSQTDIISYAFFNNGIIIENPILLWHEKLARWFQEHGKEYPIKYAKNPTYTTINRAVPINDLMNFRVKRWEIEEIKLGGLKK
jgi:hypothetical protein